MENNKKRFILGASFICAFTLALGTTIYAVGKSNLSNVRQLANAVDAIQLQKNNVDFDIRNDASRFTYTKEYTDYGLELRVTDGSFDAYQFGPVNGNYFTPESEINYYCSFTLTINSYGSESSKKGDKKYEYSEVILSINEKVNGYEKKESFKKFEKDVEFEAGAVFKSRGEGNVIALQLGAIRDGNETRNYEVKIKEFVLRQTDSKGAIVKRISFESGSSFANRWKTAHSLEKIQAKDFCPDGAGENKCKELIKDYCDLIPSQRDFMNVVAANRWITDGVAHGEVSRPCSERWRGGLFINTGLVVTSDTQYTVALNINKIKGQDFNLIAKKGQWGENIKFFNTPDGNVEFTFTADGNYTVWLLAEYGDSVTELAFSNLTYKIGEGGAQSVKLDNDNVMVRLDNDHAADTQDQVYIENSIAYFAGIYNISIVD